MNTVGSARRKEAMHALNPFAPGAGRQPKELVGREQELEIMDRIIARTKAGYSDRGLVYSGLRGVGKTVLLLRIVLLQCLFDRFGSVFPQCGLMVFPGVVIVSR